MRGEEGGGDGGAGGGEVTGAACRAASPFFRRFKASLHTGEEVHDQEFERQKTMLDQINAATLQLMYIIRPRR